MIESTAEAMGEHVLLGKLTDADKLARVRAYCNGQIIRSKVALESIYCHAESEFRIETRVRITELRRILAIIDGEG